MSESRRNWRRRAVRLGAALMIGVGAWLTGAALWMPAKAALGRLLLDRTFEARRVAPAAAQADPARWRPWPSADLSPIGRLRFPRLGESRIVLDSASGEALAWGVGHLRGSASIGAPGLTAAAGHRDGGFALLEHVKLGDVIEATPLNGETIRYRVTRRIVVDSRITTLPIRHSGPDELVLATCWPIEALASGPERLLIYASRQ
ncbi:MAG: class D sortase [Neomegalonema sp.]|nr:class D sortase [Neomegalonema sp.]